MFQKQIMWLEVWGMEGMGGQMVPCRCHYDAPWFETLLATSPALARSLWSNSAANSKSDPGYNDQHGQGDCGQAQSVAATSGTASIHTDLFTYSFNQHTRSSVWTRNVYLCPIVSGHSPCGLACPSTSLLLNRSRPKNIYCSLMHILKPNPYGN